MTKQLRLEEMIDCANETGDNQLIAAAAIFAGQLEVLGQSFGQLLAKHLAVECGETKCEPEGFAGCCTAFYAGAIGHSCPHPLIDYDQTEWSTANGATLDPMTGNEA